MYSFSGSILHLQSQHRPHLTPEVQVIVPPVQRTILELIPLSMRKFLSKTHFDSPLRIASPHLLALFGVQQDLSYLPRTQPVQSVANVPGTQKANPPPPGKIVRL
jgi:hypothetical protein